MPSEDLRYFQLRAAEERERAANAPDPDSRAAHLDLAHRYDKAAGLLDSSEHIQASYDAIRRSVDLLADTSQKLATADRRPRAREQPRNSAASAE